MDIQGNTKLVAVSNRLPMVMKKTDGDWELKQGSGGLVTALAPVLKKLSGMWIGWSGTAESCDGSIMENASREAGFNLVPIPLDEDDLQDYYYGFCNEIIWPLFHDLQTRCNFVPRYYRKYMEVNHKFAETIAENTSYDDYIWVQDYHLMHVATALREMEVERRIGFFLHIPFPPIDIFLKLPWREQILNDLLEYDLLGFQTMRDRRNFVLCLQHLDPSIRTSGRGQVVTIGNGEREVKAGAFPISIDFNEFANYTASREVADQAWYIHELLPNRQIILGIDRLDYTKGVPERLEAYSTALDRYPELIGNVSLVQLVVPSREEVPEYAELKALIERMVGEINGKYTRAGWIPIHYLYRTMDRTELLAYYRLSEIGLITPLKDGMNLVAKEYCASNIDENGVLILSEFAGAATQMGKHALMVNPYDVEGTADTIYRAYKMSGEERKQRMRALRDIVQKNDIYGWVDAFLSAAFDVKMKDIPVVGDYVPDVHLGNDMERPAH